MHGSDGWPHVHAGFYKHDCTEKKNNYYTSMYAWDGIIIINDGALEIAKALTALSKATFRCRNVIQTNNNKW